MQIRLFQAASSESSRLHRLKQDIIRYNDRCLSSRFENSVDMLYKIELLV